MKYKVIVRPEAEDDLKGAFSWYEDKRTGLGYDFLLQVDAGSISSIEILRFIRRNTKEQENISSKGFHTKSFIL